MINNRMNRDYEPPQLRLNEFEISVIISASLQDVDAALEGFFDDPES